MKLLHKILFATDFGESSKQAMQTAVKLAKFFDSEISVLHVMPELDLSKLNKEMLIHGIEKELKQTTSEFQAAGITVNQTQWASGTPFLQIIDEADKQDVNVILLGSGDKSSFQGNYPAALGVTAEKVLHKSAKPVWIVKPERPDSVSAILCPVDFSEPAKRALKNAIHLARRFNAKLYVLHVVPSMRDFYFYTKFLKVDMDKQTENLQQQTIQLEKLLSGYDLTDVPYEKIVLSGKIPQTILETASRFKTDLIIMGASGNSKSPKILMGSNTEYVIRELPSSIITVRSENIIQPMIDYRLEDLETHFNLAKKFLGNGMPREAIEQFEYCIEHDVLFIPAWEGIATCYERLGDKKKSQEYRQKAKSIQDKLWEEKVNAEVRSKHQLYKR